MLSRFELLLIFDGFSAFARDDSTMYSGVFKGGALGNPPFPERKNFGIKMAYLEPKN